jgi:hypothetical protein
MTKHPTKGSPVHINRDGKPATASDPVLDEAAAEAKRPLTEDEAAMKLKEDQKAFMESTDDDHKLLQILFRRRVINWEDVTSILDL